MRVASSSPRSCDGQNVGVRTTAPACWHLDDLWLLWGDQLARCTGCRKLAGQRQHALHGLLCEECQQRHLRCMRHCSEAGPGAAGRDEALDRAARVCSIACNEISPLPEEDSCNCLYIVTHVSAQKGEECRTTTAAPVPPIIDALLGRNGLFRQPRLALDAELSTEPI